MKTLVRRVESIESQISPLSVWEVQSIPRQQKGREAPYLNAFNTSMFPLFVWVSFVILFPFSDWGNPNIVQGRRRESISRLHPTQSQFSASDSLDEQLLQTKQWLLQRTLNLQWLVVKCVFICGVVPPFYSHSLQWTTTCTWPMPSVDLFNLLN